MPDARPPSYAMQRSYCDVDDLSAQAKHWDLDFWQLDRGQFQGELLQFGTGGVHVAEARFGSSLNQKGIAPRGLRTIAVPAQENLRISWRGSQVDGQSLMVFPREGELASVSRPDFHVYTCSFPEELLSDICETLKLSDSDSLLDGVEAIRVSPQTMKKVKSCLSKLCCSVRGDNSAVHLPQVASQLGQHLPLQLMEAIAESQEKCRPATRPKRLAAVKRAESYIAKHARDAIKVSDIGLASGVSQRTLEYAFIERFGVGPKEFLKGFRLTAVRRQLRNANSNSTRVADVANAWGFWHMGQFAADYRQRFGELPSATLGSSPNRKR